MVAMRLRRNGGNKAKGNGGNEVEKSDSNKSRKWWQ